MDPNLSRHHVANNQYSLNNNNNNNFLKVILKNKNDDSYQSPTKASNRSCYINFDLLID